MMEKNLLSLAERKQIALDIVKCLHQVCQENDIRYYMAYGTLLGAVRHKGFIPWDDDLDVYMPRKDLEKFMAAMEQQSGPYKILFYTNTPNYGYSFPKMIDTRTTLIDTKQGNSYEEIGVFVDIFPLDGACGTREEGYRRYRLLRILKRMVFLSRRKFRMESFLKTVLFAAPWLVCKAIGANNINRLFHRLCACRDSDRDAYVTSYSDDIGMRGIFPREVFGQGLELPFEDAMLTAPEQYAAYLERTYGDYMTPPPEDQRIPPHTVSAWWNTNQ